MATAAPEKDEQVVPVLEESVVVTATRLMTDRLDVLRPLRDECNQIERALNGLTAKDEAPAPEVEKDETSKPARTRRSRSGGRRDEFLKVVQDNPGITITEAAKKMGINPNYLYRLRDGLMSEKAIKEQGKHGFVAA